MAEAIAALPASKRVAILSDVNDALKVYGNGKGLKVPSRFEMI